MGTCGYPVGKWVCGLKSGKKYGLIFQLPFIYLHKHKFRSHPWHFPLLHPYWIKYQILLYVTYLLKHKNLYTSHLHWYHSNPTAWMVAVATKAPSTSFNGSFIIFLLHHSDDFKTKIYSYHPLYDSCHCFTPFNHFPLLSGLDWTPTWSSDLSVVWFLLPSLILSCYSSPPPAMF